MLSLKEKLPGWKERRGAPYHPKVMLQHYSSSRPKAAALQHLFPVFCIISFALETNSLCCTNVYRRTELAVSYGHFREVCSSQNKRFWNKDTCEA